MRRRAFTLIDLLVTLAVMAIVVALALPALGPDHRTRVLAASNLFIADLNNARTMSVQDPGDPVRVVLSVKGMGYYLARASEPETPMDLPVGVGGAYAVLFGEGEHNTLSGLSIAPEGVNPLDVDADTPSEVVFDAFGRLTPKVDQRFVLTADEKDSLTVVVRADTGDAYIE